MSITYSELPDGAYYIVPNEQTIRLRRKSEYHPGCAMREILPGNGPAFHVELGLDQENSLFDASLLVIQVHIDRVHR